MFQIKQYAQMFLQMILQKQSIEIQDQHMELQQQIPQSNNDPNQQNIGSLPQYDDLLYKQARSKFVFKVYAILTIQLSITALFIILTMNYQGLAKFQTDYKIFTILAVLVVIGTMLALICKRQLSESYPKNMIILALFTIAQSYIVSSICAIYTNNSVILAAGATAAATIGITLYVKYSDSDLSSFRQALKGIGASFVMVAMFVGFLSFFIQVPLVSGLITIFMGIIYPLYLIFDTQMIMDKGKHNLTLDQYILGSIFLYVDIIGIFLDILRIVGQRR